MISEKIMVVLVCGQVFFLILSQKPNSAKWIQYYEGFEFHYRISFHNSQCSRPQQKPTHLNVQDQIKNQRKLETFWTNIKGRSSQCAIKGIDNNPLIIFAFLDAIFWSGIDSFRFKDCVLSWHPLNQPNMACLVPADSIDCTWMCNAC